LLGDIWRRKAADWPPLASPLAAFLIPFVLWITSPSRAGMNGRLTSNKEGIELVTSYYKKLLRSKEVVLHIGKLHWRIYFRSIGSLILAMGVPVTDVALNDNRDIPFMVLIGSAFLLISIITALKAWWRRFTTEIIVTNMRVIFKRNWIAVKTRETNISNIETIDLRQSILDRLIGSGAVVMIGTGGSWEPIWPVANPRALRNAIGIG
jgi:hypothetical protein